MGRKWTQAEKDHMREVMLAKYGKTSQPTNRFGIKPYSQVMQVEPIKVPKGSTPTLPGTDGECVCCGVEYKAVDTIRRCAHTNSQGYKTGHRVCRKCSPYVTDVEVERYALDIGEYEERWLTHSIDNQTPTTKFEDAIEEFKTMQDIEEFDKSEFIPKQGSDWS